MKRRLITATAPAILVVKKEDVFDVTKAVELSHLSPEAMAAQKVMLHAIRTVRCIHNKNYCNLREMHERQSGRDLGESIALILCEPAYNVRSQQNLEKTAIMLC